MIGCRVVTRCILEKVITVQQLYDALDELTFCLVLKVSLLPLLRSLTLIRITRNYLQQSVRIACCTTSVSPKSTLPSPRSYAEDTDAAIPKSTTARL